MPRPKKYKRNEAVEKACSAFWQHGYGHLGVRALEQQTGLNRFAIHTEFGGKEGLFLEALDFYTEEAEAHFLDAIRTGNLGAIEALFRQLATPSDNPCRIYGCLMVNTVVENAELAREKIKEQTDRHFDKLKTAFDTALSSAQSQGQINKDFNIDEGAAFLVGSTMGVHVMIRQEGSVQAAQSFVELLIKTIQSWRVKSSGLS